MVLGNASILPLVGRTMAWGYERLNNRQTVIQGIMETSQNLKMLLTLKSSYILSVFEQYQILLNFLVLESLLFQKRLIIFLNLKTPLSRHTLT